jgi:4-amino-4-deoxy-L-arabinose transferase-like glycosyltransferase
MHSAAPVDLSAPTFRLWLVAILVLAALVRGLFPAADPPSNPTVGVVWHDEGAWTHNARNKALFGEWRADNWNPMYIAPVFTALEFASFKAFGVGIRQARLVSEVLGWLSVLLLAAGVAHLGGRRAGLIAAALLATNYVYVMWNRAALMETPMTAFIVMAWYCYTRAERAPAWGWGAGAFALAAFFTKASAAFFIAAIGLDAVLMMFLLNRRRAAVVVMCSGIVFALIALGLFVGPSWEEYRFYNWQMSVTRKPSYTLDALVNRASWFPVLHDLFTRMWFTLLVGVAGALGLLARWRHAPAGERLLGWWVGLGALELVLHDVGNERRFIFFIPALVALASLVLGRDRVLLPAVMAQIPRRRALFALPLVAYAAYIVVGAVFRVAFLYEVKPNVRGAAAIAALLTALLYASWPRASAWLSRDAWSPRAAAFVVTVVCLGQLGQYAQWAVGRTYKNIEASRAVGRALPPGTLVHGILANGLSLENQIRPVFVGRGFGNYEDRKMRDDVRYILTYVAPSVGYESQARNPVIQDVLDAYPNRRILMTFEVSGVASGYGRAALIDKFGGAPKPRSGQTTGREDN